VELSKTHFGALQLNKFDPHEVGFVLPSLVLLHPRFIFYSLINMIANKLK